MEESLSTQATGEYSFAVHQFAGTLPPYPKLTTEEREYAERMVSFISENLLFVKLSHSLG